MKGTKLLEVERTKGNSIEVGDGYSRQLTVVAMLALGFWVETDVIDRGIVPWVKQLLVFCC